MDGEPSSTEDKQITYEQILELIEYILTNIDDELPILMEE